MTQLTEVAEKLPTEGLDLTLLISTDHILLVALALGFGKVLKGIKKIPDEMIPILLILIMVPLGIIEFSITNGGFNLTNGYFGFAVGAICAIYAVYGNVIFKQLSKLKQGI